ncbi:MAG: NAD-dependent epimerase/dehydratase family protein [Oscillospiraceae bacterium]|nr:NAD-dependent epimerase/dehydratase family protein [Oscillospiraceae bacterium]
MATRYIVTGAAGHLGSTVVRILVERGESVRGLLLPGEQPAVPGAEYIHGNVLEPESLVPLFWRDKNEVLALIHTAGIIDVTGEMSQRLYDVNVNGTKNILALCQKYQVDKLVYVSSVHAIPESGTSVPQAEIAAFSPDTVIGGYAKTKAEATQAVLNAAANGLPAVVVHPSGIIGPYDEGRNHLVQMVRDFMEGRLPVCVKGGYDVVDVRDVAAGCIAAAERGCVGECYILSGAYHEIQKILGITAVLCRKKTPPMLPMPLARLAEPLLCALARKQGQRPLYTRYSLDTVESKTRFSSQKAREKLGYTTRSIQITIRDTVQWLKEKPYRCGQSTPDIESSLPNGH